MKARWVSGRHPLPRYSASIQRLIRCGIDPRFQKLAAS
jgi:hypothetical protein